MMGKPSGSYMFFVIAGQTDDAGDTDVERMDAWDGYILVADSPE